MNRKLRIGLVGLGNIGTTHSRYLKEMENVELTAVCDVVAEKAERFSKETGAKAFVSHRDMFADVDAIIIGTPHYDHVPIAVDAFAAGVHVMVEKPITVHVNGAKIMLAAYEEAKKTHPNLVFGIMFNERTFPHYKKIKELLNEGILGKLTRFTWINTKWFRSQAYYDSGGWRATWAGEGGGILTNQCPHNLDMYNWYFGRPDRVHGVASIGKYHNIEVEDEVSATFYHDSGLVSQFIVSTAESPGTNRMEIVGEHGTLIFENSKILLHKNRKSMLEHSRTTKDGFSGVESWETHIPINHHQPSGHKLVTERFVESILTGEDHLIAHAAEGLDQVMLANAIMLSSFENRMVDLPMCGDAFEAKLGELIKTSKFVKATGGAIGDFR
ncbi:MAG: Gfo/Idh/MocA family oxidoreductase [Defluviitaleaceae bacterium]|nr:Gfo/Idh/MocA family oxidoreductase [Defluviitaleaceae bacterium]